MSDEGSVPFVGGDVEAGETRYEKKSDEWREEGRVRSRAEAEEIGRAEGRTDHPAEEDPA